METISAEAGDDKTLRRWFSKGAVTGLAVICGQVSGDLNVRDFDTVDSYRRWAKRFPELAEILPTVQTARGYHVYFTGDLDRIVTINGPDGHEGELRGAGYVLLPPSRHPSGFVYRWTVQLPEGPIPAVDALKAGLLPEGARKRLSTDSPVTQRGQSTHRSQSKLTQTEQTEDIGGGCAEETSTRIEEIIESTIPEQEGQRNRAVFELVRTLKSEPAYADADPRKLEPIVRAWHKRALPTIRTKPFEETLIDFLKAWPKVKYPKGEGAMDVIFKDASASDVPSVALRYEQPALRQLVALCRELQRHAGDGPFFLGCRTAGRLLDVPYKRANRWLFLLREHGVLEEHEKGGQTGNQFRASRYFYVAD